jgi:SNF2 family DNA or RNA helicase
LKNRLDGLLYKIEKKELDITPPIFKEIKVEVPGSQKYTLKNVRLAMQKFTEERTAYYAARRRDDEKTYYDCMDLYARSVEKSKKENLAYYYRCLDTVIRCGGDARFCKEEMIYCNRYEAKEIIPALPKDKRDAFREAKTIVKYVKLKIQGECLGRVVGRLRIDAHLDMADHLDYVSIVEGSEKKTVVFTSYVEVVDKLITYLPETGLKPLFVYAKTNNRLSQILDQFEKDEDTNPLVATYASLSTAVPLVMADQAVLLDAPWRDYQLQQTVSRISRLGATTQTYVFTAVLDTGEEPNISTRSFDVLKWSQEQVMAITGVRSPFELTDDLEQANLTLENYGVEAVVDTKRQPSFMTW